MCEAEERIIRVQHYAEALPEWSQGVLDRKDASDAWIGLKAATSDKPTFATAFEAVKALRHRVRTRVAPDTGAATGDDIVSSAAVGTGPSLPRPSLLGAVESKRDGAGTAIGATAASGTATRGSIGEDDDGGSERAEQRTAAQTMVLKRRSIALAKEARAMPSGRKDARAAERVCRCCCLKL